MESGEIGPVLFSWKKATGRYRGKSSSIRSPSFFRTVFLASCLPPLWGHPLKRCIVGRQKEKAERAVEGGGTGTSLGEILKAQGWKGGIEETLGTRVVASPSQGGGNVKSTFDARSEKGKKAVIHMERKGKGGHPVTVIKGLSQTDEEKVEWCRLLKKELGLGGSVSEGNIAVLGEQESRVREWLEARGVRVSGR